jgi:hypothetical protein
MKNIIRPTVPTGTMNSTTNSQHNFKCSACAFPLFGNKDLVEHTYDNIVSMSSSSLSISNLQNSQISISGNKS